MAIVGGQHFTTYPVFPGTTRMLTAVCTKCFRIFGSPYRNNLLLAEHAHTGCCNQKPRMRREIAKEDSDQVASGPRAF